MERCIHGLTKAYCSECRDSYQPLRQGNLQLFRYQSRDRTGNLTIISYRFGVTLKKIPGTTTYYAFLNDKENWYRSIDETEINTSMMTLSQMEQMRRDLRHLAMSRGLIFVPTDPLTQRETSNQGPAQCWHCETPLSYEHGSLGCSQCRYYICPDGYCMCGFPGGRNYLDQYIPPQPELRCDITRRTICMTVVLQLH